MTVLLALLACNTAPVAWPPLDIAPGADAPWAGPTDAKCLAIADPLATEIDGFLYCGTEAGLNKIPVDDPLYTPCDGGMTIPADTNMFVVFDGIRARAWSVDALIKRELVNDWWGDEPLLVDW